MCVEGPVVAPKGAFEQRRSDVLHNMLVLYHLFDILRFYKEN